MRLSNLFSIANLALGALALSPLDLHASLSPQLSPDALVLYPDSPGWDNATSRWDTYTIPSLRASVSVATVSDVQATVRYATRHNIPLLVTNTGHGFTRTVKENVHDGIEISVGELNSINIDVEKNTVTCGGGVINGHLNEALFKAKKRAAVGGCDCVGLMGLGLGGGHGKLQGLYGLVTDNILSANLVLASGEAVTVSSTSHPDLYWALRGAGHNFGVVTSFTLAIHDPQDTDIWIDATYYFSRLKLHAVISLVAATEHDLLTVFTGFSRPTPDDDDDATPLLRISVQYGGGPSTFADTIGDALTALGPLTTPVVNEWPYNEIATATGIGIDKGLCIHGPVRRAHYSAQQHVLSPASVAAAYELYTEITADQRFRNTSVIFESYPLRRFQEIEAESTAYPHRDYNIISLFMINYVGAENDADAQSWGKKGREVLIAGAGDTDGEGQAVYVNYAQGDEGPKPMYWRAEEWREKRLAGLKKKYDKNNLWRAYNPVVET